MNYQLHLGDCLEFMRGMDAGSVDAVVTDPPFGIGFKYATHNDTPDNYGAWIWSIVELAESKCQQSSPIFVFQAMLNVRKFAEWFPRDWRIFAACKNFVQMRPSPMQYAYDPVLVWWTPGKNKPYSAGTLSRDWYIGNTANTLNRKDGNSSGHPCARPLDQMVHIISQWTVPGSTIFDPFMGSGTTGVACMQTGRNFIGCEIDPQYFAIAERRIREAAAQPMLFETEADTPAHQGGLF